VSSGAADWQGRGGVRAPEERDLLYHANRREAKYVPREYFAPGAFVRVQSRMRPPHRTPLRSKEFNSPAEMLARVAYLVVLASIPAALLLSITAVATHDGRIWVGGLAAGFVGWLARDRLIRSGQFEPAARALEMLPDTAEAGDDNRVRELIELLRQWDALERRRDLPDFDPWAVQAVRNEITRLIEDDPALQTLFRTHRQAA
jgi:hypothetical protein